MAWPTAADVAARTGVALTGGVTSYGLSVTELLERAKAFVESYCGREFDEAEVTETFDWSPVISVSRPPIVSVTSLSVDGVALDPEDFTVYPSYIRIASYSDGVISAARHYVVLPMSVSVTYVGGYSDADDDQDHVPIPAELKEVVLELACRQLLRIEEQYRAAKGVRQYSIGNVSVVFGDPGGGLEDLKQRLEPFRRVVV